MLKSQIDNMSISRKLNLLIVIAVLGCLLLESFSLYGLKKELLEDRKVQLSTLVDSAHSLVDHYSELEASGSLSRAAAQEQALTAISAMRYDQSNYFWINNYEAEMVMHPIKPSLNGKNLSKTTDPTGKKLFAEMVSVVKQDQQGYVAYMWSKPGSEIPVDKLSYVKGHKDWQWIIGTGIYIDDIDSVFWTEAMTLIGMTIAILAFLIFISWKLIRQIVSPLLSIQGLVKQVELTGDYSLRTDIRQKDEIGQMADSLNSMLNNQQVAMVEINQAVAGIAEGNLEKRVNANLVGDLKKLKTGVNESISQISIVLNELSEVMSSMSQGDFHRLVDLETQGIFREIADSTNTATEAVADSMDIIKATMQKLVSGDFSVRIDQDMQGDFNDLKIHVNQSVTAISAAIEEISSVISTMSQNDLSHRVTGQYEGQLAEVSEAVNASLDQLVKTVREVQIASTEVASATSQLSSASEQLAERTQNQATSLDETSSSMVDMNESVKVNSDSVTQAEQLVMVIRQELNRNVDVMNTTVSAMDGMQQSSKQIESIVELIDEIAFQTNLLALNASVEAARAGEAGKGFAVVAHEVQVLAKRSADASKDIQGLINDTLHKINESITLAHQSNEGIGGVVDSVSEMNSLIKRISESSAKQKAEISNVNRSINHLDNDTQQNAALAEETSAVANNIESQAAGLGQTASQFTV